MGGKAGGGKGWWGWGWLPVDLAGYGEPSVSHPEGSTEGLGAPNLDHLVLFSSQEKCVSCSRKFRCTQGYQLQVRPGSAQAGVLPRFTALGSQAAHTHPGPGSAMYLGNWSAWAATSLWLGFWERSPTHQ